MRQFLKNRSNCFLAYIPDKFSSDLSQNRAKCLINNGFLFFFLHRLTNILLSGHEAAINPPRLPPTNPPPPVSDNRPDNSPPVSAVPLESHPARFARIGPHTRRPDTVTKTPPTGRASFIHCTAYKSKTKRLRAVFTV